MYIHREEKIPSSIVEPHNKRKKNTEKNRMAANSAGTYISTDFVEDILGTALIEYSCI